MLKLLALNRFSSCFCRKQSENQIENKHCCHNYQSFWTHWKVFKNSSNSQSSEYSDCKSFSFCHFLFTRTKISVSCFLAHTQLAQQFVNIHKLYFWILNTKLAQLQFHRFLSATIVFIFDYIFFDFSNDCSVLCMSLVCNSLCNNLNLNLFCQALCSLFSIQDSVQDNFHTYHFWNLDMIFADIWFIFINNIWSCVYLGDNIFTSSLFVSHRILFCFLNSQFFSYFY